MCAPLCDLSRAQFNDGKTDRQGRFIAGTRSLDADLVTLTADNMDIAGSLAAATGTVTLKSNDTTDAIDLGSATDAANSTLELTATELNRIDAGILIIGDGAQDGAVTVSAATALDAGLPIRPAFGSRGAGACPNAGRSAGARSGGRGLRDGTRGQQARRGVRPGVCLLYTSPSPRDGLLSRMPSSA